VGGNDKIPPFNKLRPKNELASATFTLENSTLYNLTVRLEPGLGTVGVPVGYRTTPEIANKTTSYQIVVKWHFGYVRTVDGDPAREKEYTQWQQKLLEGLRSRMF